MLKPLTSPISGLVDRSDYAQHCQVGLQGLLQSGCSRLVSAPESTAWRVSMLSQHIDAVVGGLS